MGGRECCRGIAQNRESHGTIFLETSQVNIVDRFKLLVLFFEIPWSDFPSRDFILCETLQPVRLDNDKLIYRVSDLEVGTHDVVYCPDRDFDIGLFGVVPG